MSLISFSDNFGQISLYQIINHRGSIFEKLNNKMPKKHATKKPHSYSSRNKNYERLYFEVEGSFLEIVQNLQFLLIQ